MRDDITTDIEKINASIERWQRRLARAVTAIKKLDARRKRLVRKRLTATLPTAPIEDAVIVTVPAASETAATVAKSIEATPAAPADPVGDLPAFLDRRKKTPADEAAAAQILADRAEHKRQKALGQKARRKAQARGELRRMPLEGRAALAAIRGEC